MTTGTKTSKNSCVACDRDDPPPCVVVAGQPGLRWCNVHCYDRWALQQPIAGATPDPEPSRRGGNEPTGHPRGTSGRTARPPAQPPEPATQTPAPLRPRRIRGASRPAHFHKK